MQAGSQPSSFLAALGLYERLKKHAAVSYTLLFLSAMVLSFAIAKFGIIAAVLSLGLLIGIPVAAYSVANIRFGIFILIIVGFFLARVNRLAGDVPLGIIVDFLIVMLFVGMLYRKVQRQDYALVKSPVSGVIWLWLCYNLLELFNPMASVEAWIYVIRQVAGHMMLYFIVLEAMDDLSFFRKLIRLWIVLSVIGALYGLFQEFNGLPASEKEWVTKDPERFKLFYNWGRFRIFSFFNDPTVYGILMAFTALFCITLLEAPIRFIQKVVLLMCAGIMLLATVYTGTRTAYAMLPGGFIFFALLTLNWRTIALTAFALGIGAAIIFSDIKSVGPLISTNSLTRIRSAFKPSEDPSMQVRIENQKKIKPFIHSHPLGAGLGSLGKQGSILNPNSPVAGFPADSAYVKIAVEMGYLGLAIYCAFFAVVLIVGIRGYYRIRSPELKAYMAGLVAVVFSIAVANYPQIAAMQLPNAFIFYAIIASIVRLPDFDKEITSA